MSDSAVLVYNVNFRKMEANVKLSGTRLLIEFAYWSVRAAHKWHQESQWTYCARTDGYRPFALSESDKSAIIEAIKAEHEKERSKSKKVSSAEETAQAVRRAEFDRETELRNEEACRKLRAKREEIENESGVWFGADGHGWYREQD